jgi:hypothetical protein
MLAMAETMRDIVSAFAGTTSNVSQLLQPHGGATDVGNVAHFA